MGRPRTAGIFVHREDTWAFLAHGSLRGGPCLLHSRGRCLYVRTETDARSFAANLAAQLGVPVEPVRYTPRRGDLDLNQLEPIHFDTARELHAYLLGKAGVGGSRSRA